jgi:hypothetical protein
MRRKEGSRQSHLTAGISVLLIIIFASYISIASSYTGFGEQGEKRTKVILELFTRSGSGSGMLAEEQISQLISEFKPGDIELRIYFIGKVLDKASYDSSPAEKRKECKKKDDGNYYCSKNGPREVEADIVQLCAMEYHPGIYLEFIQCLNENPEHMPNNWKSCAVEQGLDVREIGTCLDGQEGKDLFKRSASASVSRAAQSDPTLFINNERFSCNITYDGLKRYVCSRTAPESSAPCMGIADTPLHTVTVITDSRCGSCHEYIDFYLGELRCSFPKLEIMALDYMKINASAVYEDLELEGLPAFILDGSIEEDNTRDSQDKVSHKIKGRYVLVSDILFIPNKEICDNGIDDNSNGRVDCRDSYCEFSPFCRQEIPMKLDIFIRSYQNESIEALNSMKTVLSDFSNKIDFNIYYIGRFYDEQSYQGLTQDQKKGCAMKENRIYFCSEDGEQEIDENIRQLCAKRYAPADYDFMHYIWCRNKDIDNMTDWKSCAKGLNMQRIERCQVSVEGAELLKDNIVESADLPVERVPSTMINNLHISILEEQTPKEIKDRFCQDNPQEVCWEKR